MIKKLLIPLGTIIIIAISLGVNAQWHKPLVYYQFNESSGSLLTDSSGNNFNCNFNFDNCWEPEGKFNGAFHFDGNHTVNLPATDIALTNEKGTVAFWVLLPQTSISSINCIWWAGEYGGDMFGPQNEMHINSEFYEENIWSGGEIAFVIRDSISDENYFIFSDPSKGVDPATPPSGKEIAIADDEWHHIACTWENDVKVALYIDGQAIWDSSSYKPNLWNCNLMTIGGANKRSNRRFDGYLDEFRIYDEALEAADIEQIFDYSPERNSTFNESILKTSFTKLNCFPNPAIRNISFYNSLGLETIEIFSLTGEKQIGLNVSNSEERVNINVDQLSPGFYFIKAYKNNKLITVGKFSKR